jgi:microcystin degradation protein MlrC
MVRKEDIIEVLLLRVAIARISHETNTFSAVKTALEDYDPCFGEDILQVYGGTRTEVGGFIDVLRAKGVEIAPTIAASATPSGPINRRDFEVMLESVVQGIHGAERVEGVLLSLHGAMVAEGISDTEGTLLRMIRQLVGPSIPVICTLDLHALVSEAMTRNVDAIFGFDTNPHIDQYERGVEAAETMVSTLNGAIHPVVAFQKRPMMPPTINMRTTEGPMVQLFTEARRMEARAKVINVSVFGGFPYADVERVGSSVVVVTDGDLALAKQLSTDLGGMLWGLRNAFLKDLVSVENAVERAARATEGPIILADVADNPGGGAPGDGTVILRALLEKGVDNVGFAVIKDPEAVERAIETGVGGVVRMKIGGKTDGLHGDPLEVCGQVRTITDGRFIHKAMRRGLTANVGRTAVLKVNGVEIILTEKSHAPNDPEVFRRNGIEPMDKKILVLKSRGHFRAAYEPFSKEVIEVDAPGLTSPNLMLFKYQRVPRPIWPLDRL